MNVTFLFPIFRSIINVVSCHIIGQLRIDIVLLQLLGQTQRIPDIIPLICVINPFLILLIIHRLHIKLNALCRDVNCIITLIFLLIIIILIYSFYC